MLILLCCRLFSSFRGSLGRTGSLVLFIIGRFCLTGSGSSLRGCLATLCRMLLI